MIDKKVLNEISEIYKLNFSNIHNMRKKQEIYTTLQNIANKLYSEVGATAEVIRFQAEINKYKHDYNLKDENEIIAFDEGDYFVQ